MTTTRIDRNSTVVELGDAVPPEIADRARQAIGTVLERRPGARVHVRIIDDHDTAHGRPVVARVLVDGRRAVRVHAATPEEAVDELTRRLEDWLT